MTKKHFIRLADYIRAANRAKAGCQFTDLQIQYLADFCNSTNSNFDRERWLDYIAGKCGPNGGVR